MDKSADAFRTISEVAEELDVPKHVLRFWEVKFPQIRPMKRGGGRRYYRPQDVELLRGVRYLLQADRYTIKGVQKILREQGIEYVKQLDAASNPAERRPTRVAGDDRARTARPKGAVRRGKTRGSAAGLPMRAALIAAIAELRQCREILLGESEPAPEKSALPKAGA